MSISLFARWFAPKAPAAQKADATSEVYLPPARAAATAKGSLSYRNDRLIALEFDENKLRNQGLPYDRNTSKAFAAIPSGDGESWQRVYLTKKTKTQMGLYCYANHDWSAQAKSIEVHGVRFGIEMGGQTVWVQPKGTFTKPRWS